MKLRLIIAFIGNLIDVIATLYLTHLGYAEANLVMAQLLCQPGLFILIKITLMAIALLWIWKRQGDQLANAASWIAAIMYGAIAIYYAIFVVILI